MKTVTETATANTADGIKLDATLTYDYTFQAYESKAEMLAANDMLSDEEMVEAKNRVRKNTARNKAFKVALDAAGFVKQTLENNAQLRLKTIYKSLVAGGKSHAEARQIAAAATGEEWAE